ncbi:MAG TPA: hypothetical protein VK821_12065 [Dehalococcoidia bacterium]|jgi:hypothetical protein|nr:hypothetical protein [Dehalococcoidia bacterium]
MTRAQRLLVTAVGAVIVCAITSSAAFAAGFLGPGHSSSEFADASAAWFPDATNPNFVELSVSRNDFVFRPTQNSGGTSVMQHATLLFVTIEGASVAGSECFMIPDSDFVVGSGVQSATLHATVNAIDLCQGVPQSLSDVAAGKPGGPPPVPGLQFPLTVSATWSGNGVTSRFNNSGRSTCGSFAMESHSSVSAAQGTATGSVSMPGLTVTPSPTDQDSVDQGTMVSDSQGTLSPACFGV